MSSTLTRAATTIARAFTTPHAPNDFVSVFSQNQPRTGRVPATESAAATTSVIDLADPVDASESPRCVRLTDSAESIQVDDGQTVLEALEAAGHQPKTGCRRGLCHTCVSPLHSGTVAGIDSGVVTEAGTHYRICVSQPLTDIETTVAMKGQPK